MLIPSNFKERLSSIVKTKMIIIVHKESFPFLHFFTTHPWSSGIQEKDKFCPLLAVSSTKIDTSDVKEVKETKLTGLERQQNRQNKTDNKKGKRDERDKRDRETKETTKDLAMTKSSRTMRDPSPMNFWTSSDPDTRMNVHSVWCATARASSVFPVPGGPYSNTPCTIASPYMRGGTG